MLLNLEGFQWATSLDLNMGYYHIRLDPSSKELCTIVLPFGKYEYQAIPTVWDCATVLTFSRRK